MFNARSNKLLYVKFILFFAFSILSSEGKAMLCPTNFNAIELGFTMDQIIHLCGSPDSQSSYTDTISLSQQTTNAQATGNFSNGANSQNSQASGDAQQFNDTKQKVLVITKFIYGKPQPTIMIFEDGKLKERRIVVPGVDN
jgi:Protein of unknown function (DUF2845)